MPLYTAGFAADPARWFREWEGEFGSLVPVELAPGVPAMLVLGHREALKILHNPDTFPADPSGWQRNVPGNCPVRPLLEAGPTPARTAGVEHARYRGAHVAALARVDQHMLQAEVERYSVALINAFWAVGSAELRAQFAYPLVFETVNRLVGVSGDASTALASVLAALTDVRDVDAAAAGRRLLDSVLFKVVQGKRAAPGEDVASWLLAHEAGLSEAEVVAQLALIYEMAVEPTTALILNTIRLILTDDRFAAALGGSLSTREALDEALFTDPPLMNWCVRYPHVPQLMDNGVWLPAHQPVIVSLADWHSGPAAQADRRGNRSHLAFGAGIHGCPADGIGLLIATIALDQLMDAVPDMRPAGQLAWQASPFHRSLTALPVAFEPVRSLP
ncbi:cytochrome P450 [Nocardia cyriacigeorgica]|uniref:Cytochrome P450 n=1 Tax=Nocardia cyriacigeorgica TaxID=135487 RepID=A0A6P1CV32_9NOCA|nr:MULTISPECIES: cytochrome P450 [Nocardia]NEW36429.1 cytochrome P450 [Nocardia cyriacigeorgica]